MKSYKYICFETAPAERHIHCTRCINGETYWIKKVNDNTVVVTGLFMDKDGGTERQVEKAYHPANLAPYMFLESELVKNIYPRYVYNGNKRELYKLYDENKHLKKGEKIRHDVAAPGFGYVEYEVLVVTPYGVYGHVTANTVRIGDISDFV